MSAGTCRRLRPNHHKHNIDDKTNTNNSANETNDNTATNHTTTTTNNTNTNNNNNDNDNHIHSDKAAIYAPIASVGFVWLALGPLSKLGKAPINKIQRRRYKHNTTMKQTEKQRRRR